MAVGDTYNNPGDLKSLPNGQTWQGQTGTYGLSSASGSFTSFDSMADGVRATAIDLTNAINNGFNTVQSLVYHFLGTSSNNAENPHDSNYLNAVEQGSGLSGSQTITSSDVPALVQGIFKGEGTASGVSSSALQQGLSMAGYGGAYTGTAFAGNEAGDSGFNSGFVNSDGAQAVNTIAANSNGQSLISVGSATAAGNPTASAAGAGTNATQSSGILATLSGLLTTWDSTSFVTRAVLVILGVLLLAAAFFAFTKQSVNIPAGALAAAAA